MKVKLVINIKVERNHGHYSMSTAFYICPHTTQKDTCATHICTNVCVEGDLKIKRRCGECISVGRAFVYSAPIPRFHPQYCRHSVGRCIPEISELGGQWQEEQQLKVILRYAAVLRAARAVRDFIHRLIRTGKMAQ